MFPEWGRNWSLSWNIFAAFISSLDEFCEILWVQCMGWQITKLPFCSHLPHYCCYDFHSPSLSLIFFTMKPGWAALYVLCAYVFFHIFFSNKSDIALALWRPCWSLTGLLLVLWKNFVLESFGLCSQLKSPLLVSTKINLFSLCCHETTSLTLIPDFIFFFCKDTR